MERSNSLKDASQRKPFFKNFGSNLMKHFNLSFASHLSDIFWRLLAVSRNTFIHQMNVVTAFLLNGTLEEVIYMEQPEGDVIPGDENLVCHPKKSLNRLKGAVSYFTDILLRIISLKALGQRFQVRNSRWRPQLKRARMV